MIGLRTTTGMSAVSKVIKSASDVVVGSSTISTGVGKRVSHCEDSESVLEDRIGVELDRIERVTFLGRERRRLVFSGLEENSSSSRAVTRSNAPESGFVPWTIPGENVQEVRERARKQTHPQSLFSGPRHSPSPCVLSKRHGHSLANQSKA